MNTPHPDRLDSLTAEVAALRRNLVSLLAALRTTAAQSAAMLDLTMALVEHAEMTEVEGRPVGEWFRERYHLHLEQALRAIEDDDQALAARWQAEVDELFPRRRDSGGGAGSPE